MTLPTAKQIETASLQAWPGIEVDWDGAWVRRAAGGYTKRANSLQCFDPTDDADAEQRLDQAVDWFKARGLRPVVRCTPLDSPALAGVLDARGWATIDQSHLYAMPIGAPVADDQGQISSVLDPQFLSAQQSLRGYDDATLGQLQALLAAMAVPAAGIVVYRDGTPVATGLMAIGDGIVLTGNVITDPTRRRQGLAAAMMNTGLAWAKTQGAHTAALNVQIDNAAAKALYGSLGYTHQYDYAYRVPAAA
jgi:GNAT superfamily N-acetyltransferase